MFWREKIKDLYPEREHGPRIAAAEREDKIIYPMPESVHQCKHESLEWDIIYLNQQVSKLTEALDKATQVIERMNRQVQGLLHPRDEKKPSPEGWRYGDTVKRCGREYIFVSLHPKREGQAIICDINGNYILQCDSEGLE